MRKSFVILLILFFGIITQKGLSQDYDNIFDDGAASSYNSLYLSTFDFIRGVPSITYRRQIGSNGSINAYAQISVGIQMFKPIMRLPYYTHELYESYDFFYSDSLTKAKFFELAISYQYPDFILSSNNDLEAGLVYRYETFHYNDKILKANNIWGSYGYRIRFIDRYYLLPEVKFGLGFFNYKDDPQIGFSYMFDIKLGYSF